MKNIVIKTYKDYYAILKILNHILKQYGLSSVLIAKKKFLILALSKPSAITSKNATLKRI